MTKHGCSDRVVNLQGAAEHRNPSAHASTADLELAKSLAPLANQSHSNQAQAAPSSLAESAAQLANARQHGAGVSVTVEALLRQLVCDVHRIAEHLDPSGDDRLVGTVYVATRIGLTTHSVCDMARVGTIPPDCIAVRSRDGSRWKFTRKTIDFWIVEYTSKYPPRRRAH